MTVIAISSFENNLATLSLEILGDKKGSFLITAGSKSLGIFYSKTNSNTEPPTQFSLDQILSIGNIIPELLESDTKKINEEVIKFIEKCIKEKFLPSSQYEKYSSAHNKSEEKTTEASKKKSLAEIAREIVANSQELWDSALKKASENPRYQDLAASKTSLNNAYFVQEVAQKTRVFNTRFHALVADPAACAILNKDARCQAAIKTLHEADQKKSGQQVQTSSRPGSPSHSSEQARAGSSDSSPGAFFSGRPSSPSRASNQSNLSNTSNASNASGQLRPSKSGVVKT